MKRIFLVFVCLILAALLAAEVTYIDSLRQKADAGDAEAQYNLGVYYHNGEGGTKDYKEAVKWYRLAAEQGHAESQFSLGIYYGAGTGVVQDYSEAYFWCLLAAANGSDKAKEGRDLAAKELTPQRREQIQVRAQKWFEEHR